MGLFLILFNYKKWEYDHSNCSAKTIEEWNAMGEPNLPLGILYITMGIVCEIIYVPFLIAMAQPKFMQYSCYKFMLLLGIIDMLVIPCNAIIGGVQCALGLHFCAAPRFFYVVGSIANTGWYTVCTICLVLGVNRFAEMVFPATSQILFDGKMVYFWMLAPFADCIFSMSQLPVLYHSKYFAYFFDPFFGSEYGGSPQFYDLTYECVHNITVVVFLGLIYSSLCLVLIIKTKIFKTKALASNVQKLLTIQSLCICVEIWIAAIVYIIMNFVAVPQIIITVAHICWILTHGDTPIVYLILNKSLRKAVIHMLKKLVGRSSNPSSSAVMSSTKAEGKTMWVKAVKKRTNLEKTAAMANDNKF